MEAFLAEMEGIKALGVPSDGDTAIVGSRISLQKGDRLAIVLNLGASTAATVIAALKQHNAATAGTTKALATDNPYYTKVGAATKFTKNVPASKQDTYDLSALLAANAGLVVLEVLGEELDNENGFSYASLNLDDTTAAKLISGIYVLRNVRIKPAYDLDL